MVKPNAIDEIIKKHNDKIFIIDAQNEKAFTFGEFRSFVSVVSNELKNRGIKQDTRVAVCLPNSAEFAVIYFSAIELGFCIIPINTNLNPHELEYVCKNCNAEYFIYSLSTESYVKDVLGDLPHIKKLRVVTEFEKKTHRDFPKDTIDFEGLIGKGIEEENSLEDVDIEKLFTIMYTSGTTQYPKGVAHSADNMIKNAQLFIDELEISDADRFYNVLSMAYMAGFYNLIFLPFLAGASVVIGHVFNPQQAISFWEVPVKYKVNTLWLVPTILSILLKLDRSEEGIRYCRGSIKNIFVGTAPLPVKLQEDFEAKYGLKIYESYGLSETLFISVESPRMKYLAGGVGKVLPGCIVDIVDSEGKKEASGTEGEIVVRTESQMLGYLTESSTEIGMDKYNEGFPTGDIGYLTDEGYLFITGRKKDLIIKGGINVSPNAVEKEIMQHEAVDQAVVVGIPHAVYGEDITVVIKTKDGYDFEKLKPSIIEYCKINLSQPQQPSTFFEIEEFPLTSTGKIDRKKLKIILSEKLRIPGFASQ